ncbi:hypothetical protein X474_13755 [Dethiosulfatarculus sandiegensis]|uniref:HTH tetR-type domain-containing protein n=1 Tax=Dethiosulfatarculus sandiegensis TaxID=1429043 RepID=A0A0D2JCR9_9BACT|nr:hypothetical protein X474_13755 [Dethiosulfatarculus sandiegensis]
MFTKIGFEAATTHLIAQNAGISVGGLYAHFPNKEEMFLQIIADRDKNAYEVMRSAIDTAVSKNMTPEETVEFLFSSFFSIYRRDIAFNLEVNKFARFNNQAREIHDYWQDHEADLLDEWLASVFTESNEDDLKAAVLIVALSAHEVFQYLYKNQGRVDEEKMLKQLIMMVKRFLIPRA